MMRKSTFYRLSEDVSASDLQLMTLSAQVDVTASIDDIAADLQQSFNTTLVTAQPKTNIVTTTAEIDEQTLGYIGPLNQEVLQLLLQYNVQYIQTKTFGRRVYIKDLLLQRLPIQIVEQILEDADVTVYGDASRILQSNQYKKEEEEDYGTEDALQMTVAFVTPAQLGFNGNPTHAQFLERALALGLQQCPMHLASQLCLQDEFSNHLRSYAVMHKPVDYKMLWCRKLENVQMETLLARPTSRIKSETYVAFMLPNNG